MKHKRGGKRIGSGRKKLWSCEKERQSSKAQTWNQKIRQKVLELLGNKCVKCGFSDYRALQIDHINGDSPDDGTVTGSSYYKRVIASIEKEELKYQLLCSNCNWIKRYEKNEFLPLKKRS